MTLRDEENDEVFLAGRSTLHWAGAMLGSLCRGASTWLDYGFQVHLQLGRKKCKKDKKHGIMMHHAFYLFLET